MPFAPGDAVRVKADHREGRVSFVRPGQVVVLIPYQAGNVEVAEGFAPGELEAVES